MSRVVCLGDVMVDVLARLPGPLAVGSDTPAPIALLGGGSAANTAVWLASVGVDTTLVGRVGDDELGRRAVAELAAAGVATAVGLDPVRPTGTCIVLVDADGERTMVPAAGANAGLGEQPLPDGLLTPQTHLHVSAYALFADGSRSTALHALEQARGLGCGVSVDAASSAPLRELGPERFLGWLGTGSLLLANLDEAGVLSGSRDPAVAARLLGARFGEAVVKCGPSGACWSDGTELVTVPADALEPVDSTGAGDAFAAGLLRARLAGSGTAAALAAGNALAAQALTRLGGRPGAAGQRV